MKNKGHNLIGTKLLCKFTLVTNNRRDNDVSGQQIHFFKNRKYLIVDYKYESSGWFYIFDSELSKNCHINKQHLNSYFYSKKELRTLKLNNIEKI